MPHLTRRAMPLSIALILALAVVPLICGPASAATKPNKPTVTKLELHPASEPRPALKYRLLPGFLDQTRGNAALEYTRVIIEWQSMYSDELVKQIGDWAYKTSLEELPRDEIRAMLSKHQSILDGLARAARREHCDWQLPIRDMDPMQINLSEVQHLRYAAHLLVLKARFEIAEGKYEQAIKTLQTGYALSRHLAETSLSVSALVGMSLSNYMSAAVEELIAQPGSPNMYWALTTLPSPIISIRKATIAEFNLLYLTFPEIRNTDNILDNSDLWRTYVDRISAYVSCNSFRDKNKRNIRMAFNALVAKVYPECKRALIANGISPEKVEAMPAGKVVTLCVFADYNEIRDDMLKWFALPYWQAEKGLNEQIKLISDPSNRYNTKAVASLLLPILRTLKCAEARAERSIALLRTVEAIRLYAADNEGRLPKKLSDITAVPLPIDPLRGKPFEYQFEGDTGIIRTLWPKQYGGSLDRTIMIKIPN